MLASLGTRIARRTGHQAVNRVLGIDSTSGIVSIPQSTVPKSHSVSPPIPAANNGCAGLMAAAHNEQAGILSKREWKRCVRSWPPAEAVWFVVVACTGAI